MTRYVVSLDRRLAELRLDDDDSWRAWLRAAAVDPLEVICPSELVWNDRTGKLIVETLRYEQLGRIRKKQTLVITGGMPPIPAGYPIRRNNARKENARNNQRST